MAPQSQKIDKPKKWIRHKKLEFLDKNLHVFGSMSRTLGEKTQSQSENSEQMIFKTRDYKFN